MTTDEVIARIKPGPDQVLVQFLGNYRDTKALHGRIIATSESMSTLRGDILFYWHTFFPSFELDGDVFHLIDVTKIIVA
jgi:hypothetical protein